MTPLASGPPPLGKLPGQWDSPWTLHTPGFQRRLVLRNSPVMHPPRTVLWGRPQDRPCAGLRIWKRTCHHPNPQAAADSGGFGSGAQQAPTANQGRIQSNLSCVRRCPLSRVSSWPGERQNPLKPFRFNLSHFSDEAVNPTVKGACLVFTHEITFRETHSDQP